MIVKLGKYGALLKGSLPEFFSASPYFILAWKLHYIHSFNKYASNACLCQALCSKLGARQRTSQKPPALQELRVQQKIQTLTSSYNLLSPELQWGNSARIRR